MIKQAISENRGVSSKGQKIVAALFLVTAHLPEHDPLRLKLRTLAVALIDATDKERQQQGVLIRALLQSAVLAQLISEHNASIIEAEVKYFSDSAYYTDTTIATLFPIAPADDKGHVLDKRTFNTNMSFKLQTQTNNVQEKKHLNTINKSNRHEKILSYINERKSVNIKDISSLFPDVSEKTIQRELGFLVANGKISKRGNKRWSIYLAV